MLPVNVALSFIECINKGDVPGLGRLMTPDHELKVFDEPALQGRDANIEAWRGYVASFPNYVISPHQTAERDGVAAVLGHTTGSHLGLADEQERQLTLIWLAEVVDGALRSWRLVEDTHQNRVRSGLEGEV